MRQLDATPKEPGGASATPAGTICGFTDWKSSASKGTAVRTLIRILAYIMIAAILLWFVMNVLGIAQRFIG